MVTQIFEMVWPQSPPISLSYTNFHPQTNNQTFISFDRLEQGIKLTFLRKTPILISLQLEVPMEQRETWTHLRPPKSTRTLRHHNEFNLLRLRRQKVVINQSRVYMINAQLSLEAVRRLASSINSQLVRQHIEHIDFDRFLHELDVIQMKFESESNFEYVLAHECFEQTLKAAVFDRINSLKQQLAHQGTDRQQPQEPISPTKTPDESLRSHLKRQILILNALDSRLIEITAKVEQMRALHTECTVTRQLSTSSSLSELFKEMSHLESLANQSVQAGSPLRKSKSRGPEGRLFSLFLHYCKWSKAMLKCIETIRSTLNQLIALKPKQEKLFEKNDYESDSSSCRKSVLTELLSKRSLLGSDTDEARQIEIPDSHFELSSSEVRRKEKKVRKSPMCAKQCMIF